MTDAIRMHPCTSVTVTKYSPAFKLLALGIFGLSSVEEKYRNQPMNTEDGLKIEFNKEWVHLRKSPTEPIIRIYSESNTALAAESLAEKVIAVIKGKM